MEKKGIFLENRHVSILLSAIILIGFFVFISGYFFGKKKAVEKFYSKVDQESLADHVYYSVCSNYGNYDRDQEQESTEDSSLTEKDVSESLLKGESEEKLSGHKVEQNAININLKDKNNGSNEIKGNLNVEDVSVSQDSSLCQDVIKKDNTGLDNELSSEKNYVNLQESQKEQAGEQYYAELVGFGSRASANVFCSRLKRRGITVVLKKRRSRTSRGRNVDWYQAVTEKFDNKSDLVAFVDIIKDRENLKGIKIVEC